MISLSGVEDLPNLLSRDFFENERPISIGAVVPPSLIVLISLHFIPGYLALSGLFYSELFFKPMMHRHCEKAFSADEAILQRSLLARALRLFILAVVFKGIHELTFVRLSSFLAMTIFLFESVNGSMFKEPYL